MSTRAGDIYPAEEIAAATPEPKYGINVPDAPPCAQAASLAGMLLRVTRQSSWPTLARTVADGDEDTLVRLADYRLTDEQQTLLDDWTAVIEIAVVEPGGTVCVCSGCGDWSAIGSRSVPSSCRTTAGCSGTVTKAPRATRGPVTPTPDAAPTPDAGPTPDADDLAAVIPLFGADTPDTADTRHSPDPDSPGLRGVDPGEQEWMVDPDETFGDPGLYPRPDEVVEAGDFGL